MLNDEHPTTTGMWGESLPRAESMLTLAELTQEIQSFRCHSKSETVDMISLRTGPRTSSESFVNFRLSVPFHSTTNFSGELYETSWLSAFSRLMTSRSKG